MALNYLRTLEDCFGMLQRAFCKFGEHEVWSPRDGSRGQTYKVNPFHVNWLLEQAAYVRHKCCSKYSTRTYAESWTLQKEGCARNVRVVTVWTHAVDFVLCDFT